MSRLVLATNPHINTEKELVSVDKIINCGDRKEPSDEAVNKFIEVYIRIVNRINLDKKDARKKEPLKNERN